MPHINTRSDFDDRCTCGHVRGEHMVPLSRGTEECLIVGCRCTRFQDAFEDDQAKQQKDKTY